jgi:hypothetical protein
MIAHFHVTAEAAPCRTIRGRAIRAALGCDSLELGQLVGNLAGKRIASCGDGRKKPFCPN